MGGEKFPLLNTAPFTASGNELRVMLDVSRTIEATVYGITFYVKNPTRLPNDNTWLIALIYRGELLFTSVIPGYVFGEPSPQQMSGKGATYVADASTLSLLGVFCILSTFAP